MQVWVQPVVFARNGQDSPRLCSNGNMGFNVYLSASFSGTAILRDVENDPKLMRMQTELDRLQADVLADELVIQLLQSERKQTYYVEF